MNTTHCAQEKFDGPELWSRRTALWKAQTRKDCSSPCPFPFREALEAFEETFVIDGEAIGDTLDV